MAWKSFKDESRVDWGREDCGSADQKFTRDDIKYGATLRIADALERLASGKSEIETLDELAGQKKIVSDLSNIVLTKRQEAEHLWRQISAYKGQITKLKKRQGA